MILNLFFEHYTNSDTKSSDYFDLIIKNIDKTYKFQKSIENVFLAVEPDHYQHYVDLGYTIIGKDGRDYIGLNTLTLTFFDVPDEFEEVITIKDHLGELYGGKSSGWEIKLSGEF